MQILFCFFAIRMYVPVIVNNENNNKWIRTSVNNYNFESVAWNYMLNDTLDVQSTNWVHLNNDYKQKQPYVICLLKGVKSTLILIYTEILISTLIHMCAYAYVNVYANIQTYMMHMPYAVWSHASTVNSKHFLLSRQTM